MKSGCRVDENGFKNGFAVATSAPPRAPSLARPPSAQEGCEAT